MIHPIENWRTYDGKSQHCMKRYAVISYNFNSDYIFYAPIVMWAWRQFDWNPVLMWVDSPGIVPFNKLVFEYSPDFTPIKVSESPPYRTATVAQVCRLYAACQLEGLIMTSDVDMLPLSPYWSPKDNERTSYGHDITGYTELPMCYLAMNDKNWRGVMGLNSSNIDEHIKRDLDSWPNAKSDDFYKHWGVDQQLITQRLLPLNPKIVERGQGANGARGRVDRSSWTLSLPEYIDSHLPQQVYHKGREKYFEDMMELLHFVWPKEDFGWFYDYTLEFKRLTGHA